MNGESHLVGAVRSAAAIAVGLVVVLLLWAVVFAVCWRIAEWAQ